MVLFYSCTLCIGGLETFARNQQLPIYDILSTPTINADRKHNNPTFWTYQHSLVSKVLGMFTAPVWLLATACDFHHSPNASPWR